MHSRLLRSSLTILFAAIAVGGIVSSSNGVSTGAVFAGSGIEVTTPINSMGQNFASFTGLPLSVAINDIKQGGARAIVTRVAAAFQIGSVVAQWPEPLHAAPGRYPNVYLFVSTGYSDDPRHTLAPATVKPVRNECYETITRTMDGNVHPLLCRGGGVNVLAWNLYAELLSPAMNLDAHATRCQQFDALTDAAVGDGQSASQLYSAYTLVAAYYGWRHKLPSPVGRNFVWDESCPRPSTFIR